MASRPHGRHLAHLATASLVALGVRLAMIACTPEPEGDAYGHELIAVAFLRDPGNIAVHWVWLPGWHVVLAAATLIGLSHDGVRVGNALLQAAAPFALYDLVARSGADEEAEGARDLARRAPRLSRRRVVAALLASLALATALWFGDHAWRSHEARAGDRHPRHAGI